MDVGCVYLELLGGGSEQEKAAARLHGSDFCAGGILSLNKQVKDRAVEPQPRVRFSPKSHALVRFLHAKKTPLVKPSYII